jgi:hypothetical protein
MRRVSQRAVPHRVLRSIPVQRLRGSMDLQEACVELHSGTIAIKDIAAATERTGFRTTENRKTLPPRLAERSQT